jgi:hypothetical protein
MFAGTNFYPTPEVPWALTLSPAAQLTIRGGVLTGQVASLAAPGVAVRSLRASISWGDGTRSAVTVRGRRTAADHVNGVDGVFAHHRYSSRSRHVAVLTVTAPGHASTSLRIEIPSRG